MSQTATAARVGSRERGCEAAQVAIALYLYADDRCRPAITARFHTTMPGAALIRSADENWMRIAGALKT
jgi:hypothetical protein